jgi:tRNA threonylcarbamoyladenosine biosynthesis protein TsaB
MIYLYFSLSSSFLFLALWKDDKLLVSTQKENTRLHSENFLSHLRQILGKTGYSLKEIKEIYFTSSPGGQTGIRVSLTFLATCQVLNPKIKIYHLNTLLLQAGADKCISLLTIDNQATKYHIAVYQNKECLLADQIVRQESLEKIIERFPDFLVLKDFQGIDFLTNFQKLKGEFVPLKKNCGD